MGISVSTNPANNTSMQAPVVKIRKKLTDRAKKIIYGILFVLISGGLVWGGVTIYRKANNIPKDVRVTNVTSRSVTLSWITDSIDTATVLIGEEDKFAWGPFAGVGSKKYYEDRDVSVAILDQYDRIGIEPDAYDVKVTKHGKFYTHHVTVGNLEPQTDYYFRIGNDIWWWKATESLVTPNSLEIPVAEVDSFTTSIALSNVPTPNPSYGVIYSSENLDGVLIENSYIDALVLVKSISDDGESQYLSTITNDTGGWAIDKSNFRTEDGSLVGSFSDGEAELEITVQLENYSFIEPKTVSWGDDQPVSAINAGEVTYGDDSTVTSFVRNITGVLSSSVWAIVEGKDDASSCILSGGTYNKKSGECENKPKSETNEEIEKAKTEYKEKVTAAQNERDEKKEREEACAEKGDKYHWTGTQCKRVPSIAANSNTSEEPQTNQEDDSKPSEHRNDMDYIREQAEKAKNGDLVAAQNAFKACTVKGSPGCSDDKSLPDSQECHCSDGTGDYIIIKGIDCRPPSCMSPNQKDSCKFDQNGVLIESADCSFTTEQKNILSCGDAQYWDSGSNKCLDINSSSNVCCEVEGLYSEMSRGTCDEYKGNEVNKGYCDGSLGNISPISEINIAAGKECCSYTEKRSVYIGGYSNVIGTIDHLEYVEAGTCTGTVVSLGTLSSSSCNYTGPLNTGDNNSDNWSVDVSKDECGGISSCGVNNRCVFISEQWICVDSEYYSSARSNKDVCGNRCNTTVRYTYADNGHGTSYFTDVDCPSDCGTGMTCVNKSNKKISGSSAGTCVVDQLVCTGNQRLWRNPETDELECAVLDIGFVGIDSEFVIDVVDIDADTTSDSDVVNMIPSVSAAENYIVDGNLIYLPEAGYYQIVSNEQIMYVLADGNENGTMLYIERNGVDGYQTPLISENSNNNNEDLLLENLASYDLQVSKVADTFNYILKQGINIVSLNFFPTDDGELAMTADSLIKLVNNNARYIDRIAYFDSGKWSAGLIAGDTSSDDNIGTDFSLSMGTGYLIVMTDATTISIPGNKVEDSVPLAFKPGWNLVGIHGYSQNYTAQTLLSSISELETLNADNVTSWSTSKGRYEGLQVSEGNVYGFDFPISEQLGYFVRVNEFTPEDSTVTGIIWNPGGDAHGDLVK